MWALIKHELGQIWRTPATLYALILSWTLLYTLTFFWGNFLLNNQADFNTLFSFVPWVLLFLAPALAMFGWPEEARRNTISLLRHLPPKPITMVMAKIIAQTSVIMAFLLGTLPFLATVMWLGNPEVSLYLTAALSTLALAVVLLASSNTVALLTARPLVAFVLAAAAALTLLYLLPMLPLGWSLPNLYQTSVSGYIPLQAVLLTLLLSALFVCAASARLAQHLFRPSGCYVLKSSLLLLLVISLGFIQPYIISYGLDTTPNNRHTLHPSTITALQNITTPLQFTLYTPQNATKRHPLWQAHIPRTTAFLQRLISHNPKLTLNIIHPDASATAEYAARQAGITPQPIFFGLSIANPALSSQKPAVLPHLSPTRATHLEFDIMAALNRLTRAKIPQIGLLTEMNLGADNTQRPQFLQALVNSYGVKKVSAYDPEIPQEIDLLIVLQTPTMSAESVYALDQYMVKGGRAIILLDPFFRTAPSSDLRAPDRNADAKNLDHPADILRHYGIDYNYNHVAADNSLAMPIELPNVGRTRYPLWLNIGATNINQNIDLLTNINSLLLIESGYFRLNNPPAELRVTPLITTSPQGQHIIREDMLSTSPQGIASALRGEATARPLALLLEGNVTSMYANLPDSVRQYALDYAEDPANITLPTHHVSTTMPTRSVVIADLDFLSDDYTLATQNGAPPSADNPFQNQNIAFMFNLVQGLLGEEVLLPLRARADVNRPFTRLDNLLIEAATQYQQLEAQIGEQLLQTAADKAALQNLLGENITPTPAQTAELEAFAVREITLQRQLRNVQTGMKNTIQYIGYTLMSFNYLLPPLLAWLLWLSYIWRRNTRLKK